MICIDVGLYDLDCVLISDTFTAELWRGMADGDSLPVFYFLGVLDACLSDPENPPAGSAFYYQVVIIGSDGNEVPACGT